MKSLVQFLKEISVKNDLIYSYSILRKLKENLDNVKRDESIENNFVYFVNNLIHFNKGLKPYAEEENFGDFNYENFI
jgi:hypothetical protein